MKETTCITVLMASLFITACTPNYIGSDCQYGRVVYEGNYSLNNEKEAEQLLWQYRKNAVSYTLPPTLSKEPPEPITKMTFVATAKFSNENKIIAGWVPEPYGYVERIREDNITLIRGIFIGKDGKIYSFRKCR